MTYLPQISRSEGDGVVVLSAEGEFDLATVEVLRTAIGAALADYPRIVLDLSGATFLDSTSLAVLVAARHRATRDSGWIRLVSPQPIVRKLLRVTDLDTVLGVYESAAEATAPGAGLVAEG